MACYQVLFGNAVMLSSIWRDKPSLRNRASLADTINQALVASKLITLQFEEFRYALLYPSYIRSG